MNGDDCWLDSLPADAEERRLLHAGLAERPAHGAVDRGWNTFCTSVGVAAAAGATLVTSAAPVAAASGATLMASAGPSPVAAAVSSSTAANVTAAAAGASQGGLAAAAAAAAAATGNAGVGLAVLPLATKATIIGFSIGLGMLGSAHVVERIGRPPAPQTMAPPPHRPPSATAELRRVPPKAQEQTEIQQVPLTELESTADAPHRPVSNTAHPAPDVGRYPSHTIDEVPARERPLSAQAEELARIKRLLDSGATNEALAELRASVAAQALSLLAEDRDALYIDALKRSSNLAEAKRMAQSFCARYPHSPHRERFQGLLESE